MSHLSPENQFRICISCKITHRFICVLFMFHNKKNSQSDSYTLFSFRNQMLFKSRLNNCEFLNWRIQIDAFTLTDVNYWHWQQVWISTVSYVTMMPPPEKKPIVCNFCVREGIQVLGMCVALVRTWASMWVWALSAAAGSLLCAPPHWGAWTDPFSIN